MSSYVACAAFLAACKSTTGGPYGNSEEHANRLSLYVGRREYEKSEWEPVEEQAAVGFDFAHCPGPIGFEGGLFAAREKDRSGATEFTGKTAEFFGGLRLVYPSGSFHPYVGAGLSSIFMKLDENGDRSQHDGSIGGYLHAGATVDLSKDFFLGLDLRGLRAGDVDVLGQRRDVDYTQLAFVIGFSF